MNCLPTPLRRLLPSWLQNLVYIQDNSSSDSLWGTETEYTTPGSIPIAAHCLMELKPPESPDRADTELNSHINLFEANHSKPSPAEIAIFSHPLTLDSLANTCRAGSFYSTETWQSGDTLRLTSPTRAPRKAVVRQSETRDSSFQRVQSASINFLRCPLSTR